MLRIALNSLLLAILLSPTMVAAELTITGIDKELERNVRSFATIASEPCDAEEWIVRRRFRTLESGAQRAIQPFGYYRPTITTNLSRDDKCWRAEINVEPGEPVRLRSIDIRVDGPASEDPSFSELLAAASLAPGEILRHADYDRLKRTLQVRAADRGYFDAEFSASRLDIWPDEGIADVTLRFQSGPRYRIGEIQQEQQFIDPSIVLGYLDLDVDTPYNASDIARAYRDLSDSAYFGQIEILPDVENATDEQVPVRILLQPGNRIEYTVGVGASTDTGPRFRAGFRNNRINQHGHRLIADLGVSPVVQGLTAEYRIPLADPRREWFSLTGALSNEETDSFDNEALRLGIRWTKVVSESWLRTLSIDASRESFEVGQDVDTIRSIVPAINFDHKRSDRDIFPRRGRRLGVELRGTDEAIGSSNSFFQASVWMRWIRSFGEGNRLLARLNAGVTASGDFSALPPSVRFFAGGDESVRGFDYNSPWPERRRWQCNRWK